MKTNKFIVIAVFFMIFMASACSQAKYSSRTRTVKTQNVYAKCGESVSVNHVSKVRKLRTEIRENIIAPFAVSRWENQQTSQVGHTFSTVLNQPSIKGHKMLRQKVNEQVHKVGRAKAKIKNVKPILFQLKKKQDIINASKKIRQGSKTNTGNGDILYILLVILLVLLILSVVAKLLPIFSWLLGIALLLFLIYLLLQLL